MKLNKKLMVAFIIVIAASIFFAMNTFAASDFFATENVTPFQKQIDGALKTFFCIDLGTPIGIGTVSEGQTYGGWVNSYESTPKEVLNQAHYVNVSVEEMPQFLSYILTGDAKEDSKLIQYAIWASSLNEGRSLLDYKDYKDMPSYNTWIEKQNELTALTNEINSNNTKLEEYTKQVKKFEAKVKELEASLSKAEAEGNQTQIQTIRNQIEQNNKIIQETKTNITTIGREIADKLNKASVLEVEVKRLQKQVEIEYTSYYDTVSLLYSEAMKYQEFHDKVEKAGGYSNLVKNMTDEKNLKVIANTEDRTYMVGPFNVTYPNEHVTSTYTGNEIYFDWIQNIYLVDQNGNKISAEVITDQADGKYGVYPASGANFFLKFKASDAQSARGVKLHVDFGYIKECTGKYDRYEGSGTIMGWELQSSYHGEITDKEGNVIRDAYTYYWYKAKVAGTYSSQKLITVDNYAELKRIEEVASLEGKYTPLTMILSGLTFVDRPSDKTSTLNGKLDTGDGATDLPLEGVEVTLYESNGNLAVLAQENEENPDVSEANKEIRTNPTITNSNGAYEFKGLDPMKKYYVVFRYNGQIYKNVEYMVGGNNYNSEAWIWNSKATEGNTNRNNFNNQYAEIGSTPNNYISSNSLGYGITNNVAYQKEEIESLNKEILQKTREYINKYKKYPNLKTDIYDAIIRTTSDKEVKAKLQFIEDSKMNAYTGKNGTEKLDYYPVLSKFVIAFDEYKINIGGYTGSITPLYFGQRFINLGVYERDKLDLSLRKDVYKATLTINGKTHVYNYDKRQLDADNNWEIKVRLEDGYYDLSYNRPIYKADYDYRIYNYETNELNPNIPNIQNALDENQELKVYVTYKITAKNRSVSNLGAVAEVVDYFDKDYTFKPTMSYVGTSNGEKIGDLTAYTESKYGASTHNTIQGYNTIYVRGLENTKLAPGETAYMFLTFEVNKENGSIQLDELGEGKENIAEINGYTSYETDGSVAGLIDQNSKPGNLTSSDKNTFEDDTDKAPNIKLVLYRDENGNYVVRQANGISWEDEKTVVEAGAKIGDGIRGQEENKISGVTVQLVEIRNEGEYIWQQTQTDANGYYEFKSYVPGNYVIRFQYGDSYKTVLTKGNKLDGIEGQNDTSYNGLEYKSTVYQAGLNTYNGQNETATYIYDIAKADTNLNISDAKDILSRRNEVTTNFKTINNHLAEVATSYKNNPENKELVDEFIQKSKMRAETGLVDVEVEYNRTETSYGQTTEYVLRNIDLGLIRRAQNQITLSKDVERVKVILSNGKVEADTNIQGPNGEYQENVQWIKGTNGFLNIIMDQEIMHGARVEVLYKITATNTGDVDYLSDTFYYTGKKAEGETPATTTPDLVVDYVDNHIIYRQEDNEAWKIVTAEELQVKSNGSLVNDNINLKGIETIIVTDSLSKQLAPGESTQAYLTLSKTISAESEDDDLAYNNIAEILKTTSQNGTVPTNSLVGNQDPNNGAAEVDTDTAEQVAIVPPQGETRIYYVLGAVLVLTLGIGIVVIKKYVLD